MSVNKIFLLGRVGKDVEVKEVGGVKCAAFTIATSERFKDKNGEVKENTEWHNIVAWRVTADICERFIHKGDQVYVEGKIKYRTWESNGEKRYATDIVADKVESLTKREGSSEVQQTAAPSAPRVTTPIVDDLPPDDSGLPF